MQRVFILCGVMTLAGLVAGTLAGAVVGYRVGRAPLPLVVQERDQLRTEVNTAHAQLETAQSTLGSTQVARNAFQARISELETQIHKLQMASRDTPHTTSTEVSDVADDQQSRRERQTNGHNSLQVKTIGGDGKFVQLTNGEIYEISAASWSEARNWRAGMEVRVKEGPGNYFPIQIINSVRGEVLHAELTASK